MTSGNSNTPSPIITISVWFLLLASLFSRSSSLQANTTFRPGKELLKYRRVKAHLKRLNKPPLKTIHAISPTPPFFRYFFSLYSSLRLTCGEIITRVLYLQSPDGDLVDCIPSHLQPAFDHPRLRGQKPLEPPERPRGYENTDGRTLERFQLWRSSGESCPEGTVAIRRTRGEEVLKASSIKRFGRKPVRRDSESGGHEHAVGFVGGDQFYGAKASLNVWAPKVTGASEFSLSQIWVISGSFGDDLNTIEAGWQVSPQLYGDNFPRFFTYWTTDAYQATGCYNLLCSGFVQTNNKIAIGAAISPTSAYNGSQFDISILIWKDPKHRNWWLEFGPGLLVGYWPSILFSHLTEHASMVQFGGEVVNAQSSGIHSLTQMGSGHFAREGFGRASYFRNLQVVDWDNSLVPLTDLHVLAEHPNCYDIQGGVNSVWGSYFYYGGPGRSMNCP